MESINIEMRVRDLILESDFGSDEVDFSNPQFNFANDRELLEYLRKKERSACHAYIIFLEKMARKYPQAEIVLMAWIDALSKPMKAVSLGKSPLLSSSQLDPKEHQEDEAKFIRLVKAKRSYDQAFEEHQHKQTRQRYE